jgi:DNA modification methylase
MICHAEDEIAAVLSGAKQWTVICGESEKILPLIPANSIHACIDDPPGGGDHLSQGWDSDKGGRDEWIKWLADIQALKLRIMLPGAYTTSWCWRDKPGWTHRAMEDAGFRMLPNLTQVHMSGCTNGNLDVAKAVESFLLFGSSSNRHWCKLAGKRKGGRDAHFGTSEIGYRQGYRAALVNHKGAFDLDPTTEQSKRAMGLGTMLPTTCDTWQLAQKAMTENTIAEQWLKTETGAMNIKMVSDKFLDGVWPGTAINIQKGSLTEKEAGLESLPPLTKCIVNPGGLEKEKRFSPEARHNSHPTVKGITFMEYLVNLLCPPGGIVVDCFNGSGTTGCACRKFKDYRYIGIEKSERHVQESILRIKYWEGHMEREEKRIKDELKGGNPDQLMMWE